MMREITEHTEKKDMKNYQRLMEMAKMPTLASAVKNGHPDEPEKHLTPEAPMTHYQKLMNMYNDADKNTDGKKKKNEGYER